ncbi:MAG: hypothetical protein ACRD59_08575 [Candidatus Acidiferrales bacterium]
MPGDIIEIVPESEPSGSQSDATARLFAEQYAAFIAEQNIHAHAQQMQRHRYGLPTWLALAIASGAIIALAFVYFLAA